VIYIPAVTCVTLIQPPRPISFLIHHHRLSHRAHGECPRWAKLGLDECQHHHSLDLNPSASPKASSSLHLASPLQPGMWAASSCFRRFGVGRFRDGIRNIKGRLMVWKTQVREFCVQRSLLTCASRTSFTLPTWPKPCANEVAKHNHPMWACCITDPPTASCYQPPDVALTFRLLGGCFDYGVDISTVGWTFQLWGRCFDHGADVSTVGRTFRLWGGCFDCGVCVSTLGWTFLLHPHLVP